MLHSECNKVVPFFCRLFFRVPPNYLPSNEVPPSLKSLATPLNKTFKEERLIIYMKKYNLAAIFKNKSKYKKVGVLRIRIV